MNIKVVIYTEKKRKMYLKNVYRKRTFIYYTVGTQRISFNFCFQFQRTCDSCSKPDTKHNGRLPSCRSSGSVFGRPDFRTMAASLVSSCWLTWTGLGMPSRSRTFDCDLAHVWIKRQVEECLQGHCLSQEWINLYGIIPTFWTDR